MGFLTRLRELRANPMENPSVPLASGFLSTLGWLFGGNATASNEIVSEFSALQHVTVYACVRVIAESIGSLTLRTYKRVGKGRSEAIEDPIWKMLALMPNDEMSASVLWENVAGCMALCGNSYLEILRNKAGNPLQLYPLHCLRTKPVRLPSGSLAYRTIDFATGGERIIASKDCLHFRLFSWDGLAGLSPIQQARQTIGWAQAAVKQSARFVGNNSTPPGILTRIGRGDDKAEQNMRKFWESSAGGQNSGRTAVLSGEWKYQQIGINAKDSQWLESMQFSRSDIAALFRVLPGMVGELGRMSNNNAEQQSLSFVIDTLRPYLVRIEQEIAIKLLGGDPGRFVEFDVSQRLRGDWKSTMDGFAVGRQWGILTADECREQIGYNPLGTPEGEITIAPVNMQAANRMLATESIQDQPVNAPPEPSVDPQMRSMMLGYGPALLSIAKDAVGRVATRSKRDSDSLTPILAPMVDSIATLAEFEARRQLRLPEEWRATDKGRSEYMRGVARRAMEWKIEDRDGIAGVELHKALSSITYTIYREAGAALAERNLNAAA